MTRDQAVVFVPAAISGPADFAAVAAPCLERVEACGYELVGVVRSWENAQAMLADGRAHVLIVAAMSHLPADRRPRIETVSDPVRPAPARAEHVVPAEVTAPQRVRRPRRIVRGVR
ncbi:hypothetical protein DLJ47_06690 [Micromonospora sp. S4605]|uniref:hypothetical protein n=1 Tax=Micromonospora sp. S4605 TaxID=1420897 RepID=UPI000D702BA1|nr:hypothetical protein [Micromonospora sp. S4605]PWU56283.1 hypothetical protein DLJ47_06690 [Micromonospora sp. S4605]